MKLFYLFIFIFTVLSSSSADTNTVYKVKEVPKNMSVKAKKKRFFNLLVPVVSNVYIELINQYIVTSNDIKAGINLEKIEKLKTSYGVKSNKELLIALKPHPPSIVLAQAAMESAWATSRFFREANNVFGVWSVNKNEARIAAGEKRGGTKTIWLRKFDSLEESVREYYKMLAKARVYREFREVRYNTNNPYEIVKKLDKYSEIGKEYTLELSNVIRYNKLIKYD